MTTSSPLWRIRRLRKGHWLIMRRVAKWPPMYIGERPFRSGAEAITAFDEGSRSKT